jgi:hypothetical protein
LAGYGEKSPEAIRGFFLVRTVAFMALKLLKHWPEKSFIFSEKAGYLLWVLVLTIVRQEFRDCQRLSGQKKRINLTINFL